MFWKLSCHVYGEKNIGLSVATVFLYTWVKPVNFYHKNGNLSATLDLMKHSIGMQHVSVQPFNMLPDI